ncbi:MAG TPA: MMPL family transporter [Mycobacteriales bacterium]|nr:MMPL family transporter [Mycobacteriales bacterium]
MGRFLYRWRRVILPAGIVLVLAVGFWGSQVIDALVPGGYDDPASESSRAAQAITDRVGEPAADVVVLYHSDRVTVANPRFVNSVRSSLANLPGSVTDVRSYYSTHSPALVSHDRRSTYAVLTLRGDDNRKADEFDSIKKSLHAPGLSVHYGGIVAVNAEANDLIGSDLERAELISFPLLLLLLLIVFRSVVAAALPLLLGGVGILGALAMLHLIAIGTDVSIFALNIVTMLGLGIAVDYALFIVSRFREELPRHGGDTEAALQQTMATAGRTVAFSGLTVAVSISSLILFPQVFLKSMGYGGVAAVLVDMIGALTILPALLAILGPKVDALRIRLPHRRSSTSGWYRIAHSVMRRPILYAVVLIGVLLTLAAPFTHARFGGFDATSLPAGSQSRAVSERLAAEFPGRADAPIQIVLTGEGSANSYVDKVRDIPGVTGAAVAAHRPGATLVELGYGGSAQSTHASDIVHRVRDIPAPQGMQRLVGGTTAANVDLLSSLGHRLPLMAIIVAVSMFVLLFLAFGSLVLPLKAIVMNALSLAASFGVITWIFQDGHLGSLLGVHSAGYLDSTDPVLMLGMVFGLSMDYEVFLLSRMRERWDATGDNADAVATGLQRSGRIITSAALLLVVVIGAFSTSDIIILKMLGVGMVVAIVVDATLVRALLVPATMRLLGHLNWWAPAPLRRLYDRIGMREEATPEAEPRPLASVR